MANENTKPVLPGPEWINRNGFHLVEHADYGVQVAMFMADSQSDGYWDHPIYKGARNAASHGWKYLEPVHIGALQKLPEDHVIRPTWQTDCMKRSWAYQKIR